MDYPEPLIIPPRKLPHKHTFILLHGRGSSGEQFGPALLATPISLARADAVAGNTIPPCPAPGDGSSPSPAPTMTTLDAAFPHARFVFPTAARRRATIYRRAYTKQWFDCWKLDPPATEREELQSPGLQETTSYLHSLMREEIARVAGGASNVVIGGLSQGCAASLIASLLWEGDPLGAVIGLCGWLPFCARLSEQLAMDGDGEDSFDPFERGDDDPDPTSSDAGLRALIWLREEVQVASSFTSPLDIVSRKMPTFLGHGILDDRVGVVLGRDSSRCLRDLGISVSWKEYESLGHWYSGPMLRDLVEFLDRLMNQK